MNAAPFSIRYGSRITSATSEAVEAPAQPQHKMPNGATSPASPEMTRVEIGARGAEITAGPSPILMMPGAHAFLWCVLSSAHPGGGRYATQWPMRRRR